MWPGEPNLSGLSLVMSNNDLIPAFVRGHIEDAISFTTPESPELDALSVSLLEHTASSERWIHQNRFPRKLQFRLQPDDCPKQPPDADSYRKLQKIQVFFGQARF